MSPSFQDSEIGGALISIARSAVSNPTVADAVKRGLEVRDAALEAQTALLGALNLPTAADLGLVVTRLRSISQRLELIEENLDSLSRDVKRLSTDSTA